MIDRNDGADADSDTKCGQDGVNHMNVAGEVISVKKVADRRCECDSGDERHDVSDDDLIVEDGAPEETQSATAALRMHFPGYS